MPIRGIVERFEFLSAQANCPVLSLDFHEVPDL
jgi:hypothetical protein